MLSRILKSRSLLPMARRAFSSSPAHDVSIFDAPEMTKVHYTQEFD